MNLTVMKPLSSLNKEQKNSEEVMSENLERSLPSNSTELEGEESCEILKQRIHHTMELVQLLNSIKEGADNKSIIQAMSRHLAFLEKSDPEWPYAIFR